MTEQLFQIGIKALIQNDEHQILLLKSQDYWDIPGGRMDQGEDIEAALLRELHEEIGVDHIANNQLWDVAKAVKQLPYDDMMTSLMLIVYHVQLPADQIPRSCEPGVTLHWVSPEQAADYLKNKYPEAFRQAIAQLS
ncbi:NUDIX hydrolase [Candidatus Nanosynbacter featherlites]|uniref:NUDIX hydrolase n=1 Tax=Candidatus Nanosynbacter featherlites TaxID=2572088 RepID=A0A4P9A2C9_9BACT|nr:NUDIX hydrolase [Candidatus Nanosynbacter featherlites]QCT41923.1 NUDIX hydrolase [Candidatus Nanosynbacter featherlites]